MSQSQTTEMPREIPAQVAKAADAVAPQGLIGDAAAAAAVPRPRSIWRQEVHSDELNRIVVANFHVPNLDEQYHEPFFIGHGTLILPPVMGPDRKLHPNRQQITFHIPVKTIFEAYDKFEECFEAVRKSVKEELDRAKIVVPRDGRLN